MVKKFPNGTGAMMELLKAEPTPITWTKYFVMPVADQTMWEERVDTVTKAVRQCLVSTDSFTLPWVPPTVTFLCKQIFPN